MADVKKLQATIKATVIEIAANGQTDAGKAQAQQIIDLAKYHAGLGEHASDIWGEFTGVKSADESMLRSYAAEMSEASSWDVDLLWKFTAFAIRMAGAVMGLGATTEWIVKAVASATRANPEAKGNPEGLSSLALALR